jgi:predicted DNA-binding transcriptional regulator YafY
VLQRAVVEGVRVRLGYAGRDRPPGERIVHPLGLVKRDVWYLLAGTDNGRRTFRVDRVTSAEPTGEPAVRPEGFDLAAAWTDVSAQVERLRGALRVEAIADPSVLGELRGLFGVHVTGGKPRPDGRVEVAIGGDSLEQIASDLAGLGARVEVVGPPKVRGHLARIAVELATLYA